ncbi:MAG: FkbM family methyltransferase [Candidatus Marsarchaeota archaeon]|nr:FkbM family methyltransferase [Candidatus Marsarchaeota archaeon]
MTELFRPDPKLARYALASNRNVTFLERIFCRLRLVSLTEMMIAFRQTANLHALFGIVADPNLPREIKLKGGITYSYKGAKEWLGKVVDMEVRDRKMVRERRQHAEYLYNGRWLKFAGGSLLNSRRFHEIFITQPYKKMDCDGSKLVDIGADIGDTAIYFLLKGASMVYGFEPYPSVYKIARKNVALNGLSKKVRIFNEGCADSPSFLAIDPDSSNNQGSMPAVNFKSGMKIRMRTLEELVRRLRINDGALKVDCEGWEYDIILNASRKTLRKFRSIIIEYHYGYMNLERKLRDAGFKVSHTLPYYTPKGILEPNARYFGMIYASRE